MFYAAIVFSEPGRLIYYFKTPQSILANPVRLIYYVLHMNHFWRNMVFFFTTSYPPIWLVGETWRRIGGWKRLAGGVAKNGGRF